MATSPNDITAAFVADAISVQEAAQKLAAPARDAYEKDGDLGKVEHELEGLWSAVINAAEQTPHDKQDKLVDIVRAIKDLPQPKHEGKRLEIWGEEQRWEQLPLFGGKAREALDICTTLSHARHRNRHVIANTRRHQPRGNQTTAS